MQLHASSNGQAVELVFSRAAHLCKPAMQITLPLQIAWRRHHAHAHLIVYRHPLSLFFHLTPQLQRWPAQFNNTCSCKSQHESTNTEHQEQPLQYVTSSAPVHAGRSSGKGSLMLGT